MFGLCTDRRNRKASHSYEFTIAILGPLRSMAWFPIGGKYQIIDVRILGLTRSPLDILDEATSKLEKRQAAYKRPKN